MFKRIELSRVSRLDLYIRKYWICIFFFILYFYCRRCKPLVYDEWVVEGLYYRNNGFLNYLTGYCTYWLKEVNGRFFATLLSGILEQSKLLNDISLSILFSSVFFLLIDLFDITEKRKDLIALVGILFLTLSEGIRWQVYFYAMFMFMFPVVVMLGLCLCMKQLFPCSESTDMDKRHRVIFYVLIMLGGGWNESFAVGLLIAIVFAFIYVTLHTKKINADLLAGTLIVLFETVLLCFMRAGSGTVYVSSTPEFFFSKSLMLCTDTIISNPYLFACLSILSLLIVWNQVKRFREYPRSHSSLRYWLSTAYMVYIAVLGIYFILLSYNHLIDMMRQGISEDVSYSIIVSFLNQVPLPNLFDKQHTVVGLAICFSLLVALIYPILCSKNWHTLLFMYICGFCSCGILAFTTESAYGAREVAVSVFLLICICIGIASELPPPEEKRYRKIFGIACFVVLLLSAERWVVTFNKINDIRIQNESSIQAVVQKQRSQEWDYAKDILYLQKYGDELLFGPNPNMDDVHYKYFCQSYGLDAKTIIKQYRIKATKIVLDGEIVPDDYIVKYDVIDLSKQETTCDVKSGVSSKDLIEASRVQITCWALIPGIDTQPGQKHIVLEKDGEYRMIESETLFNPVASPELSGLDSETNLNYAFSTFIVDIADLPSGEWEIWALMDDGAGNIGFSDTGACIESMVPNLQNAQEIHLPNYIDELTYHIESIKKEEKSNTLILSGWAYLNLFESARNGIDIILEQKGKFIRLNTITKERPDVTAFFSKQGKNRDNSGFYAITDISKLPAGTWRVLIAVNDMKGNDGFVITDSIVESLQGNTDKGRYMLLPSGNARITYDMGPDSITFNEGGYIVNGHAYIEGNEGEGGYTYIILEHNGYYIKYDTTVVRKDVNNIPDYSGFKCLIKFSDLAMYKWSVFLYIENKSGKTGLINTGIIIGPYKPKMMNDSEIKKLKVANNINCMLNSFMSISDLADEYLISGWAFLNDTNAVKGNIRIILERNGEYIIFRAHDQLRPDVTDYFKGLGLDLDHSGFFSILDISSLKKGDWEILIGITDKSGSILYADTGSKLHIN